MYRSGILDSDLCGTELDHAVVAVGYGTEKGKDYVLIRNSWSTYWGEGGYIRIALKGNDEGICGVLMDSHRPTTN